MGKVSWHKIHNTPDSSWMVLPNFLRGPITGQSPVYKSKDGREPTNRLFAEKRNITTRQASKQRRGY